MPRFSFLTNHGLALLVIAHDPQLRLRDIAEQLGITERATQRIVADLVDAGYIHRMRHGRRNSYSVRLDLPAAIPVARDLEIGALLSVLVPGQATERRRREGAAAAPG